jgi:hypothetical protein
MRKILANIEDNEIEIDDLNDTLNIKKVKINKIRYFVEEINLKYVSTEKILIKLKELEIKERNLALEAVRVTEAAASSPSPIHRLDDNAAASVTLTASKARFLSFISNSLFVISSLLF